MAQYGREIYLTSSSSVKENKMDEQAPYEEDQSYEEQSSPGIDYMMFLPLHRVVEFDFKFANAEPILQALLEQRQNGPLNIDYWKANKLMIKLLDVQSPDKFTFHLQRHYKEITEMRQKMIDIYTFEEICPYLIPVDVIQIGMPVVVLDQYYSFRAYVTSMSDDRRFVSVRPVDGVANVNPSRVNVRMLRLVHKEIGQYPRFVYTGKLAGIQPPPGGYKNSAASAFRTILSVQIDPQRAMRQFVFAALSYFTTDNKVAVCIYTEDKEKRGIWVGDELVRRNLAVAESRPIWKLPDRVSSKENEQMALLLEIMASNEIIDQADYVQIDMDKPAASASTNNTASASARPTPSTSSNHRA